MAGMLGGGAAGSTNSQAQARAAGLRIQTSVYGTPIPLVYGRQRIAINLIWYGQFQAIKQEVEGAKGGQPESGGASYIYKAGLQLGLCEGPIQAIPYVWMSKGKRNIANTRFVLHLGTYPQDPWTHLTSTLPSEALPYPGLAHADYAAYNLGTSDNLPSFNFLVDGLCQLGEDYDCDPADVLTDFLTNAYHGAGFPSARFPFPQTFSDYCQAAGLLISCAYTGQEEASGIVSNIVEHCNSELYCSQGQLLIRPYGDTAIAGDGGTYTPPTEPDAEIGVDDLISRDGEDPVKITRRRPADIYNEVRLEYANRYNDYNSEPAVAKSLVWSERYGLRTEDQVDAKIFCEGAVAHLAAGLRLNRQMIMNSYEFVLGWKWIVLDPMDIVSITEPGLGLVDQWVRVKEISEDENGELTIRADEYVPGSGHARAYPYEYPQGYMPNRLNDPGNANEPLIFEAPDDLTENREVWVATAGGVDWGGCEVWVSTDGSRYKKAGKVEGPARYGTLRSIFPTGTDPDTTNTIAIDLSISNGEVDGGTQDDADNYSTLCYVDGEICAYQSASIVSNYQYDLGTYIRRGLHGTTIAEHASGAWFAMLDEGIAKLPYKKKLIGKALYIKLVSFNVFGKQKQDIDDIEPYLFTPTGNSQPWERDEIPEIPEIPVDPGSGLQIWLKDGTGTEFYERDLQVTWTDMRDLFPGVLFKDYQVDVMGTDGVTVEATYYAKTELFKYKLTQNRRDFGGTASRTIKLRVRCRAKDGRLGDWTAVTTFTNSPASMEGYAPTVTSTSKGIDVDWESWTEPPDIKQYLIYCDTSETPTTLKAKCSGRITHKRLNIKVKPRQVYYVKIVPVDEFG